MNAVAVAVKGELGGSGGKASRRAVRWAVENLLPTADSFVLVHVMPKINAVPTPSGGSIPVDELDKNVVAMFIEETKLKFEDVFVPFKKLCKSGKVETVVLEHEDPATALIRYVDDAGLKSLVLGSCSAKMFSRKQTMTAVPEIVVRCAPETCDVYVISANDLVSKSVSGSRIGTFPGKQYKDHSTLSSDQVSRASTSSSGESISRTSALSKLSYVSSLPSTPTDHSRQNSLDGDRNHLKIDDLQIIQQRASSAFARSDKSEVRAEIEQLRLELQATVSMYERVCEDLVHAQNEVQFLSSECLEEAEKVKVASEREETLRKVAAEQKAKHMEALKEVEKAKALLADEEYKRQIAELDVLKGSAERRRLVNALLLGDERCRRYSKYEIELATDNFSDDKVIGEGAYGKVYKCNLDHTPVAVKVIQSDSHEKREEFLREVEVLSQLRHPHVVLLLGVCPDSGCLIYEYMENGSLDEYIYRRNGRPSLPWTARFRIIFEIACGLAFLHNSKPEPVVHRDMKPGNILLDRNYVSKIGDVGLAKLISDAVPDNVTMYQDSVLAGTMYYMDPEYQHTGTVRPKSDLFGFGMIILQLLVGRHPKGLLVMVVEAVSKGTLRNILDNSVRDWPVSETEELAQLTLSCLALRCRDRPDLESEVLPTLKRLADFAEASLKAGTSDIPSHFFCPIMQEVMVDPYIAADGFTYEHQAIKAWLERRKVSPVTKRQLPHSFLTPNNALRAAIQEWRSRATI